MKLSEAEWSVMESLWRAERRSLAAVSAELKTVKGWSKTTVHTYLTRMEAKGLVRIDKDVTPHVYYATTDRESCQKNERQSFLSRVYSGSAGDLIAAFLKEEPISAEERERLRRLLDEMEV